MTERTLVVDLAYCKLQYQQLFWFLSAGRTYWFVRNDFNYPLPHSLRQQPWFVSTLRNRSLCPHGSVMAPDRERSGISQEQQNLADRH
jgi:hypothetical protein